MEAMPKHVPTYYERLGQFNHDFILRCADCRRLVLHSALTTIGGCNHCGNRRVEEVRSLNLRELLRIKLGLLRFPYSEEFLAEFLPKGWLIARLKGWWSRG